MQRSSYSFEAVSFLHSKELTGKAKKTIHGVDSRVYHLFQNNVIMALYVRQNIIGGIYGSSGNSYKTKKWRDKYCRG